MQLSTLLRFNDILDRIVYQLNCQHVAPHIIERINLYACPDNIDELKVYIDDIIKLSLEYVFSPDPTKTFYKMVLLEAWIVGMLDDRGVRLTQEHGD